MSKKTVSIHQPNYLPYLGFFDKVKKSDVFVILDNVQFVKSGEFAWQHRNRIRTKEGWIWLTTPVKRNYGQNINEVVVANNDWQEKHWKSILSNYNRTVNWESLSGELKSFYGNKYEKLVDVNIPLIEWISDKLGIKTKVVIASEMGLDKELHSTSLIIEIIKQLKGDVYISGKFGAEYLDKTVFEDSGIELMIQDFKCPVYRQRYEGFVPNLSVIDFMFNTNMNI